MYDVSNPGSTLLLLNIYFINSIKKRQNTVNNKGEEVSFLNLGRHDPCVLPRAVPVVEAMTAICLMDMYLLNFSSKIDNLKKT